VVERSFEARGQTKRRKAKDGGPQERVKRRTERSEGNEGRERERERSQRERRTKDGRRTLKLTSTHARHLDPSPPFKRPIRSSRQSPVLYAAQKYLGGRVERSYEVQVSARTGGKRGRELRCELRRSFLPSPPPFFHPRLALLKRKGKHVPLTTR